MFVCFVDIGRIVDHHFLNYFFILINHESHVIRDFTSIPFDCKHSKNRNL